MCDPVAVATEAVQGGPSGSALGSHLTRTEISMIARGERAVMCAWETPLRKMAGQGTVFKKMSIKSKLNSATFAYVCDLFWPRFPKVTRVCAANTWVSYFADFRILGSTWLHPENLDYFKMFPE